MSARDLFHDAVKNALKKEEWVITHHPLEIEFEKVTLKIDLARISHKLEKIIGISKI
ncbi:XisH protein [Calothrix sp. PCC 7507]|uniref:XisH protein n=1 Tax=Calothrix sp. PCC 7507 TaxID=99598 RepID=UPI00029F21AF|nr:XisH protein [Calothrix sp. PCC 7507]AFY31445.1 XisH protein [Calothrix sp. PCC 7507]